MHTVHPLTEGLVTSWRWRAIKLSNWINVRLAIQRVGEVWRLAINGFNPQNIVRHHDELGPHISLFIQQDQACGQGLHDPPATLIGQWFAAGFVSRVKVGGSGTPAPIGCQRQRYPLCHALHVSVKARQGSLKGFRNRNESRLCRHFNVSLLQGRLPGRRQFLWGALHARGLRTGLLPSEADLDLRRGLGHLARASPFCVLDRVLGGAGFWRVVVAWRACLCTANQDRCADCQCGQIKQPVFRGVWLHGVVGWRVVSRRKLSGFKPSGWDAGRKCVLRSHSTHILLPEGASSSRPEPA